MMIAYIILQATTDVATQSKNVDWNAILGWIFGGTGLLLVVIKGVIDRKDKKLASELTINEKKVDKELLYTQEKIDELAALKLEVKDKEHTIIEKEKIIQKFEIESAVSKEIMANQDLGTKRLLELIKKIAPESASIIDSWNEKRS